MEMELTNFVNFISIIQILSCMIKESSMKRAAPLYSHGKSLDENIPRDTTLSKVAE